MVPAEAVQVAKAGCKNSQSMFRRQSFAVVVANFLEKGTMEKLEATEHKNHVTSERMITQDEDSNGSDVYLPEVPLDQVPKAPFEPATIPDLPSMTLDKLAAIEGQLASEFASLSKEYVDARAARIDHLLKLIDELISAADGHDRLWTKIYNEETKHLEHMIAAPELYLLGYIPDRMSDDDLKELLSQVVAPRDLDDIRARSENLPFAHYFKKIFQPYEKQLDALRNHYDYQIKMIDNNVKQNQIIVWKRYQEDLLDQRNALIERTNHELSKLYEEYHGIRANQMAANDWDYYFKSVVPIQDMAEDEESPDVQERHKRGNIDSYYDIDNRYFKKNKIQLTKTKLDALERWQTFEAQQGARKIPQRPDVKVRLTECDGLSQDEVDDDILLIRSSRLHEKALETFQIQDDARRTKQTNN